MSRSYTTSVPVKAFQGLRALNTQSYTESNTKLGIQYELSIYEPVLSSGGVHNMIFQTGDKPVVIKARLVAYTGEGLTANIYESPTFTGGINTEYYNATNINPVDSTSTVLNNPIVTDPGDQLFATNYAIGNASNRGSGSTGTVLGGDHVLRGNTTYLFTLSSLDNQVQGISSYLTWYEGELDLPRPKGSF